MRLQVFLSHSGVCSRRKALEWVKAGRIKVNGQRILEPSYQVNPAKDSVRVDGKQISLGKKIYLMLNKPREAIGLLSEK